MIESDEYARSRAVHSWVGSCLIGSSRFWFWFSKYISIVSLSICVSFSCRVVPKGCVQPTRDPRWTSIARFYPSQCKSETTHLIGILLEQQIQKSVHLLVIMQWSHLSIEADELLLELVMKVMIDRLTHANRWIFPAFLNINGAYGASYLEISMRSALVQEDEPDIAWTFS